jgi:hypothetical protein
MRVDSDGAGADFAVAVASLPRRTGWAVGAAFDSVDGDEVVPGHAQFERYGAGDDVTYALGAGVAAPGADVVSAVAGVGVEDALTHPFPWSTVAAGGTG